VRRSPEALKSREEPHTVMRPDDRAGVEAERIEKPGAVGGAHALVDLLSCEHAILRLTRETRLAFDDFVSKDEGDDATGMFL
jgi:hypothetical protein